MDTRQHSDAHSAFTDMLNRQFNMNAKYCQKAKGNSSWLYYGATRQWDYALAALEEVIELANSIGYVWWKPQVEDPVNQMVEVVDMHHFIMSLLMAHVAGSSHTLEVTLETCTPEIQQNAVVVAVADLYADVYGKLDPVALSTFPLERSGQKLYRCKTLMVSLLNQHYDWTTQLIENFAYVAASVGITTVAKLHGLYLGKLALNEFRSNNGYKDGTYKRDWNGRDDNEVLMEHLLHSDADVSYDNIYNFLRETYLSVLFSVSAT